MLYTNNSFLLSHFLWSRFSHTAGCDDRTWELSLSHLRRSCLCVNFFWFVRLPCVCVLSESCNSTCWNQNMQTLSTILLLICFLWFCKVKKKELQNCAWNSEFAICRECNLTLFCLTAIYWETCLFICGFLIFRSPSLALALSVHVEWNRMAACMQGWVSSVQKIFYIQFLRLFPCFVLFFVLFSAKLTIQVSQMTCLIIMNIRTMITCCWCYYY